MTDSGDGASTTGRELARVEEAQEGALTRYVPMLATFQRAQEFLATERGQRVHMLLIQLGLGDLGRYFDPEQLHVETSNPDHQFDLERDFVRPLEGILEGLCPHKLEEQQELPFEPGSVFMGALLRPLEEGRIEDTYTNLSSGNTRCVDMYELDQAYVIVVTNMVTGEYRYLALVKNDSGEGERYEEFRPYDADGDSFPTFHQVVLAHLLNTDDLKGYAFTNAILQRTRAFLGDDRYTYGMSQRFLAV